jgi:Carboxypeptidase regulatory-like domain
MKGVMYKATPHASLLLLLLILLPAVGAQAQTAAVSGRIVRGDGSPVPGLTVSLVHPQIGRSQPISSDETGHFVFYNVPIHPEAYYVEIYWGERLIYRNSVLVHGDVIIPNIVL